MSGRWVPLLLLVTGCAVGATQPTPTTGPTHLVIVSSPSVAPAVTALATAFEERHHDLRVQVYYDSGLALRQTIATIHNSGRAFTGGPLHIIAPGGDELIDRLESRRYVARGSRTPYARVPLALVVPEGTVEAPSSFQAAVNDPSLRIAIADPALTTLGQQTAQLLEHLAGRGSLSGRVDVAADSKAVIDHLLSGLADVAILFGPEAVRDHRVRVVAWGDERLYRPSVHSMAMDRLCSNRPLCEEFLEFIKSPAAQALLKRHGYLSP